MLPWKYFFSTKQKKKASKEIKRELFYTKGEVPILVCVLLRFGNTLKCPLSLSLSLSLSLGRTHEYGRCSRTSGEHTSMGVVPKPQENTRVWEPPLQLNNVAWKRRRVYTSYDFA
jgi:hypothetical protein